MKQLLLTVSLLLLSLTSAAQDSITIKNKQGDMPPAQLGISPPKVAKTISVATGKAINQSIIFYNYNDKPKLISVELMDTDQNLQVIAPNANTLMPWTILNPKNFEVPAGGRQTIRMSIRLPQNFEKKTHYAALKINQHVKQIAAEQQDGIVINIGSSYILPVTIISK